MTDEAMGPLRRRMIEDMTIRKFALKTQHDYVQRIKNFAAFVGPGNIGAYVSSDLCIENQVSSRTRETNVTIRGASLMAIWPERKGCDAIIAQGIERPTATVECFFPMM